MAPFEDGRALLQALRDRLDEWVAEARREAYAELFEGPDAAVTESQRRRLDAVDSWLTRETGTGLWNADEYGIIAAGTLEEESTPHVVCTNHPQIPEFVNDAEAPIDDETRDALNDVLWEYCERVAEIVQHDIEEFVWSSEVESWHE